MSEIYSRNNVDMLLGSFLIKPQLSIDSRYKIDRDDDFIQKFHSIVYTVIYNLALDGCNKINTIDFMTFIEPYKTEKNICEDNNIISYLETIRELASDCNIDHYYNQVRKLSCVRKYKEKGFDIKELWDEEASDESNLEKINSYSIEDIIKYFDIKLLEVKRQFSKEDEDTTRKKAGTNSLKIFCSFKENPTNGLSFESKYLTTLWGTWKKGQLYIRSGDTSSGKSRSVIGDLANVCCKEFYDLDKKEWVENPNGVNNGLYIGCEMELNTECEPLFYSYMSGIESSKILKGKTTDEEDRTIERAISSLNDSNIYLTDMPSFNIKKIEEEIKYYKTECNIEYVAFDYMLLNNSLVKEFVEQRGKGVGIRGDEILLELSKQLKDMCKKYDIGMISATQVNADIKDFRNRDYQVLRGGKAIADKATGGSISMPITEQELKLIEPYLQRRGFGNNAPNFVETVYKSRFSEYPKECKIFSYYNLGNMRREEMFVTTKDFKPIGIKKTIIRV